MGVFCYIMSMYQKGVRNMEKKVTYKQMTREEESSFILNIREGVIPFKDAVEQYHKLIWKHIHEIEVTGIEDEDKYSILLYELHKAIHGFDITKGFAFSTYLSQCLSNKLSVEREYLTRQIRDERIYESALKLDKHISNKLGDDNLTYGEYLLNDRYTEKEVNLNFIISIVEEVLKQERERSQYVVREILFANRSKQDVANELGLSHPRVSQIYKASMQKIQRKMLRHGVRPNSFSVIL